MHFDSLEKLAVHLGEMVVKEAVAMRAGLEKCAQLVEKTAISEFGRLQPAVGPFPAWAELAESTKEDKERLGYVTNADHNPLVREGQLKGSISHETNVAEAVVGSTDPVMPYQEFGTSRMPPRPVLGPAAYRNKKKIAKILSTAAMTAYFNYKDGTSGEVHESLGYKMDVK